MQLEGLSKLMTTHTHSCQSRSVRVRTFNFTLDGRIYYRRQIASSEILVGLDQWVQVIRSGIKRKVSSSPIIRNSIFE